MKIKALNPEATTETAPAATTQTQAVTPPPVQTPAPAKAEEGKEEYDVEDDSWISKLSINDNQKKHMKRVVTENINRRQTNADLTDKNAELSKKVKEYEDKEKAAQRKKDEEDGNFKKINDELKADLALRDQRLVRAEIRNHAIKEGIVDPSMIDLLPLDDVTLDEKGNVLGAESFIKKLKKDRAYLFGAGTKTEDKPQPTTTGNTTPSPNSSPKKIDALSMSDEEFAEHLKNERSKKK